MADSVIGASGQEGAMPARESLREAGSFGIGLQARGCSRRSPRGLDRRRTRALGSRVALRCRAGAGRPPRDGHGQTGPSGLTGAPTDAQLSTVRSERPWPCVRAKCLDQLSTRCPGGRHACPPSWVSVRDGKLWECLSKTLFGVVIVNSASNSVANERFRKRILLVVSHYERRQLSGRIHLFSDFYVWRFDGRKLLHPTEQSVR